MIVTVQIGIAYIKIRNAIVARSAEKTEKLCYYQSSNNFWNKPNRPDNYEDEIPKTLVEKRTKVSTTMKLIHFQNMVIGVDPH